MNKNVILDVENVSKQYRLGEVGSGSVQHDLKRWWANIRGQEDPFLKIGEANDRTQKGESDYVWALQDINFQIEQGQAVGIIGRNGAGKSTLLKLLSRVTKPTTGSIKYQGRIASLLEVGTGFHPDMTGRENVYLNGAILGMTKKEITRKFDEIVAFAGVERYIDTPVKRYSSGMYVRLAFAVAAHLESEILIVDEVLAVGDAEFQKKCLGKMNDVSQEDGRTILFVSHNMAAVKQLCQYGIVMQNGKLTYQSNVEDAVNYYLANSFENAYLEIKNRADRKGDGRLRIKNIFIKNSRNTLVEELTSGEPYTIILEFDKFSEINAKTLSLVLQFKNDMEELITTIATDEMGVVFEKIPNQGAFMISIPRLLFRKGRYTLSFHVSEKPSALSPHITIDYLSEAIPIIVEQGDYWNSGFLNRAKGFIQEASINIM